MPADALLAHEDLRGRNLDALGADHHRVSTVEKIAVGLGRRERSAEHPITHQVAPRDHHTVGCIQDRVEVLHALEVLDLADDGDIAPFLTCRGVSKLSLVVTSTGATQANSSQSGPCYWRFPYALLGRSGCRPLGTATQ